MEFNFAVLKQIINAQKIKRAFLFATLPESTTDGLQQTTFWLL